MNGLRNSLTFLGHVLMIVENAGVVFPLKARECQNARNAGKRSKMGRAFALNAERPSSAVPNAAKCSKMARRFCGQCGAAVNGAPDSGANASPVASYIYPVATQVAVTGTVRFTLPKPFFAKLAKFLPVVWFTNTILLDGYDLRTIEMGETIDLEIPVGPHTIQLVHAYRSITTLGLTISRKSNLLQLTIAPEMLPAVSGVYDYLWQKFDLSLQGYFPLG